MVLDEKLDININDKVFILTDRERHRGIECHNVAITGYILNNDNNILLEPYIVGSPSGRFLFGTFSNSNNIPKVWPCNNMKYSFMNINKDYDIHKEKIESQVKHVDEKTSEKLRDYLEISKNL